MQNIISVIKAFHYYNNRYQITGSLLTAIYPPPPHTHGVRFHHGRQPVFLNSCIQNLKYLKNPHITVPITPALYLYSIYSVFLRPSKATQRFITCTVYALNIQCSR